MAGMKITSTSTAPAEQPADASPEPSGRRPVTRDTLLTAALGIVGPHRSVATLGLREVAREAGIAPNSFYRHFRDTDELAVALIEQAGEAIRKIFGDARARTAHTDSVTRTSIEVFMAQLDTPDQLLPLLLREGSVGSQAFKHAVETQLKFFEAELQQDLVRLEHAHGNTLHAPDLAARAITRLMFTMGATALDRSPADRAELIDQTVQMVRMIITGALTLAGSPAEAAAGRREDSA